MWPSSFSFFICKLEESLTYFIRLWGFSENSAWHWVKCSTRLAIIIFLWWLNPRTGLDHLRANMDHTVEWVLLGVGFEDRLWEGGVRYSLCPSFPVPAFPVLGGDPLLHGMGAGGAGVGRADMKMAVCPDPFSHVLITHTGDLSVRLSRGDDLSWWANRREWQPHLCGLPTPVRCSEREHGGGLPAAPRGGQQGELTGVEASENRRRLGVHLPTSRCHH